MTGVAREVSHDVVCKGKESAVSMVTGNVPRVVELSVARLSQARR